MGHKMQPIRDKGKVHDAEVILSRMTDAHGRRMFLLWEIGIRLGMRVSDLVRLKVGDLVGKSSYTYLPQKQSHKVRARPITITFDPKLKRIIQARLADRDPDEWVFPSRQRDITGALKPITRQTARNDMRAIAQLCGLGDSVGCHTMRKTFGYHYYQKTRDIAFLQEWFYHETPSTTLIYIGVNEDMMKKRTDMTPFDDLQGVEL